MECREPGLYEAGQRACRAPGPLDGESLLRLGPGGVRGGWEESRRGQGGKRLAWTPLR